jgi:hypothetical protein
MDNQAEQQEQVTVLQLVLHKEVQVEQVMDQHLMQMMQVEEEEVELLQQVEIIQDQLPVEQVQQIQ